MMKGREGNPSDCLHLYQQERQVRRGVLAADMDAGEPENPGAAVRATLPAERGGWL